MSEHVEGCDDISPLHHLAQGTPLQHLGAEDIPGLLRQKAHMDQNLQREKSQDSGKSQHFSHLLSTASLASYLLSLAKE